MPNYCYNLLTIEGTRVEVEQFALENKTDAAAFDLANVAPPPPQSRSDTADTNWAQQNWGTSYVEEVQNWKSANGVAIQIFFITPETPPATWLATASRTYAHLDFELLALHDAAAYFVQLTAQKGQVAEKDLSAQLAALARVKSEVQTDKRKMDDKALSQLFTRLPELSRLNSIPEVSELLADWVNSDFYPGFPAEGPWVDSTSTKLAEPTLKLERVLDDGYLLFVVWDSDGNGLAETVAGLESAKTRQVVESGAGTGFSLKLDARRELSAVSIWVYHCVSYKDYLQIVPPLVLSKTLIYLTGHPSYVKYRPHLKEPRFGVLGKEQSQNKLETFPIALDYLNLEYAIFAEDADDLSKLHVVCCENSSSSNMNALLNLLPFLRKNALQAQGKKA